MNDLSKVESVFLTALGQATDEARSAYLDDACKDDPGLREQVNCLLAVHPKAVNFMGQPAAPSGEKTAAYVPTAEQVGTVVAGRYKLLEMIGEGGMGEVWVADQIEPIRRRVALKLIKPGMDSRSVLARFEAERQALALMDHPNIAKVLDAGTTADGRPYFVMELVKGTPITEFCDARKLSARERLELFVPVCQAIQHAHTKGIIHRDIKPSNVLVALHDERPVPKVIDFGIAKAVGQQLTEKTIYTGFGGLVGTPAYMAPEQATFNQLDIDTRADVYALGVLLYELLAGSPPVEPERLKKAALDEVLRLVRDEEPPRPSQRLSTSQSKASIAAVRQTDPTKLANLIRGELDWIVMKALEKDRNRRYETANGFAADVQRYLAGEQVQAVPPSARYRLRKFARKNRVVLTSATAFAGLLIAAVAISSWLAVQARQAKNLAEEKRHEAEMSAKDAAEKSGLYQTEWAAHLRARLEAEIAARSIQIDFDMASLRSDGRVGLLRLARPYKQVLQGIKTKSVWENGEETGFNHVEWADSQGRVQALRELVTAVVLAAGQDYAPLMRPITHDGDNIQASALNSKGDRLLTRGADNTARLWDPFTGGQIAILRRASEKIIDVGLSPDGATAFTHSLDGMVRLWGTKDGAFFAEIDPRTGRSQSLDGVPPGRVERGFTPWTKVQLSNDRVLTYEDMWKRIRDKTNSKPASDSKGPVELWDATTGRFVGRLELPTIDVTYQFFGNGRWIERQDPFHRENLLQVFSAENGRAIAKLKHDEKYGSPLCVLNASPSGRTAATVSVTGGKPIEQEYYVHCWDTTSWRLISTTGPFKWGALEDPEFQLLADDVFTMSQIMGTTGVFRPGAVTPIAELPGGPMLLQGDRVCLNSGQLFDTRTWRRLQPPKGHKLHPEITRFAPDGRFVPLQNDRGEFQFLDATTEKTTSMGSGPSFYQARLGWVGGWVGSNDNGSEIALHRLPPPDRLDIPPDLLELWAQVAVRGEIGPDGEFVKWNEPTWEKKRQELAAIPTPSPDLPFPGYVATDKLHWLRAEYSSAREADKLRLAKQLLDRAEAAGDKIEAFRWRAILNPTGDKAVKPNSK